jgi:hypothetical protein
MLFLNISTPFIFAEDDIVIKHVQVLRRLPEFHYRIKTFNQCIMQEVPFASFFEEDDLFEQSMTEDFFQGQSNNSFYQCCGAGMFIPDPNFSHPGSASKNLSILFPSSRKYDPGCSSRILIFYPSRIPDPGVKKPPDPDSQHCVLFGSFLKIT